MALTDSLHSLNGPALSRAVAIGLVVVLPVTGLSVWVINRGDDTSGNWALVGLMAVLAGFGLAGAVVSRAKVELPYTHGALAGLITFAAAQTIVLIISALVGRDGDIHVTAITTNAFLAAAVGMVGAIMASRSQRSSQTE